MSKGTLALLLALSAACAPSPSATITVATTTSVMGSGMLDTLGPLYLGERQVTVHAVPVGSGRALKMPNGSLHPGAIISPGSSAAARCRGSSCGLCIALPRTRPTCRSEPATASEGTTRLS